MQNDNTEIKRELDAITKIIADTVPVEAIYLFGSYAYGTPHKDSDLDLYVVLKDETPIREAEAMDAIQIAMYKKKTHPVDLLASKQNRFRYRAKGFATIENTVAQHGIKLYG